MSLRAPSEAVKSDPAPDCFGSRQLAGKERAELERSILTFSDIKAVDRSVLAALFERFRGKAVCWPGNASLATEAGVCPRTVTTSLARLVEAGIVSTVVDTRVRARRRIVLMKHPDSAAALVELEASPHVARSSDACQTTAQILPGQDGISCAAGLANPASEASESQAPEPEEFAGGGDSLAPPESNPEILRGPWPATPPEPLPAPVASPLPRQAGSPGPRLPVPGGTARRLDNLYASTSLTLAGLGWLLRPDWTIVGHPGSSERRPIPDRIKPDIDEGRRLHARL